MSITDELRKWAKDNTLQDRVLTTYPPQHAVHGVLETLLRIADRIDAEHENEIIKASLDSTFNGYIALPKDADGEYIHEHDKVDWHDHAGTWHESATVVAVCNDGCYVVDGAVFHVHKSDIRHYHAPTVEDVLREFGDWYAHTKGGCDEDGIIAEYASKLRLAEEDA